MYHGYNIYHGTRQVCNARVLYQVLRIMFARYKGTKQEVASMAKQKMVSGKREYRVSSVRKGEDSAPRGPRSVFEVRAFDPSCV